MSHLKTGQPMCKAGSCAIKCTEYRSWAKGRGLSETTIDLYARQVNDCALWLTDGPVESAALDQLETYVRSKASVSHRNLSRSALISYLDFLRGAGAVKLNIARDLTKFRKPKGRPKPLPRERMPDILSAATQMGPMVEITAILLTYTALRRNEVRGLRWDGVARDYLTVIQKGGQQRLVIAHPEVFEALERWRPQCRSTEWVLPSPRIPGQPVSGEWVYGKMKGVGLAAGVPDCRPHRFRHGCLTEFYLLTRDLLATRDFAGHVSASTTEVYIEVALDRTRQGVEQLNFRI
jgi:integrase/recombinase XerD